VRPYPDKGTVAVIPCSDYRVSEAALLCHAHGIRGPRPSIAAIASSKALTYDFLARAGFEVLYWQVPRQPRDLLASFDRPVIVKPDSGAGSYSPLPWGYRVFDDLRDFRRYLRTEGLTGQFFEHQADERTRSVVMECVPSPRMFTITTVVGDGEAMLYDRNTFRTTTASKVVDWMLMGDTHPDLKKAVAMANAFAAAGMHRSILYLQSVERGGRLFPIDLNLRPGTMWELAAEGMGARPYETLLAAMLGLEHGGRIAWPAPYVGIRKVLLPKRRKSFRVAFGAVPLISRCRFVRGKPYDLGHAWPLFAVPCQRPEEFDRRADAIIAATRILPA
jgi:hypothetical protein